MRHFLKVLNLFGIAVLLTACASSGKFPITESQLGEYDFSKPELIELGKLVEVAYTIFRGDETVANPPFPDPFQAGFKPIRNLQGRDNPKDTTAEYYGHLSWKEDEPKTLVITIRGTSDGQEWLDDFKFAKVWYSENEDFGHVEKGFHEIFKTFTVSVPGESETQALSEYLAALEDVEEILVVGHSLGSSLATLVAFEANLLAHANKTELLTFASPLTGDQRFVNAFQTRIVDAVRVVNRPDLVPRVPPKLFGFRHIWHELEYDSHPNPYIKNSVGCYHSLLTYLHLLDSSICLEAKCGTDEYWAKYPQCPSDLTVSR